MNANFTALAFLFFAGVISSSVNAVGIDNDLDYRSSQAIVRAIEACKADGCYLNTYRFTVRKKKDGTEVVMLGKQMSADNLFSGNDEYVTERHYLVDLAGQNVVRKWYGK